MPEPSLNRHPYRETGPSSFLGLTPRQLGHISIFLFLLLTSIAARQTSGALGPFAGSVGRYPFSETEAVSPAFTDQPGTTTTGDSVQRDGQPLPAARSQQSDSTVWRDALPQTRSGSGQPPARPKAPTSYTVEEGDTVGGIAERFGISSETVLLANNLANPDDLQIGDKLTILPVTGILHKVESGDNINDLALLYGVNAESIATFNGIGNPDMVQVGTELVVPDGKIQMARVNASSRGSRLDANVLASGSFRWPVAGWISQGFIEGVHRGVDLAASMGEPVYASDGGVVVTALKLDYDYGWHLVIDHGNGYRSVYAHLSRFNVDYGDRVSKGDLIGWVGSTGLSTGPHLHLEFFQGGTKVNPLKYLP